MIQWSADHHPVFLDQDAISAVFHGYIGECEGPAVLLPRRIIIFISMMHFARSRDPWSINFFLPVDP
jgi:hypothetical protein